MDESRLRCSDAERDACADRLHAHASAGRLTPAELDSRLKLVRTAMTRGHLADLLDDLPEFRPLHVPADLNRCSDADREDIIARLRHVFAEGRLTRPEFEERLEIALIARTYEELRHVLSDLPGLLKPVGDAAGDLRGKPVSSVTAPGWPSAPLPVKPAAKVPARKSRVTPGQGGIALLGPICSVIIAGTWARAASSVWTPGTPSPYFIAGIWSAFLAAPVLMMLLVPLVLWEERRNSR